MSDLTREENMLDSKLRDDVMFLKGQLESLRFPFVDGSKAAYYDLIDSIYEQYNSIIDRISSGKKEV